MPQELKPAKTKNVAKPTPFERVIRPFQRFASQEASGGIVLILATVAALVVANSGANGGYLEWLKSAVSVELTASPRLAREMKEYEDVEFEFTVRNLTFLDKVKEKWPEDKTGALVTKLERGGWADIGELDVNDLIVKIGSTPITSSEDVEKKMTELKEQQLSASEFPFTTT